MTFDIVTGRVDNKFDFSTYLITWMPALGTCLGILMWRPKHIGVWLLWLAGTVSFGIGNTLSYFGIPEEVTTPSIRDVFYLAGWLYLALAVVLVTAHREDRRDPIAALSTAIITLGLTSLIFANVIVDLSSNEDGLFVAQQVAYIVLQMVFVASVVRLWLASQRHTGTFWLVAALTVTQMISFFTESEMQAVYQSGGEPEFGSAWFIVLRYIPTFLGYILAGMAPMHCTMWRFGRYRDASAWKWNWKRELIIIGFMFAPIFTTLYHGPATTLRVLAWICVFLVIVRYWLIGYLIFLANQVALAEARKEVNGAN